MDAARCPYRESESGIALIAVLLAMALITVIGAALTAVGVVEYRASINHRSASQALQLADAGAIHALAAMRGPLSQLSYSDLLRGHDGLAGTADDGVLDGFGLDEFDALPDTGVLLGGGRYYVKLQNDDADPSGDPTTDQNDRVVAVCRGETPDGGKAEVRIVLAAPAFPAIVSNGDLLLPGNPDVLGPCAGVHANKTLTALGSPVVDGTVTASDTVILSGTIRDAFGYVVTPGYGPPVEVPEYDIDEHCEEAEYLLHNGWVVTVGPPRDSAEAKGAGHLGWKWQSSTDTYTLSGSQAVTGTHCVIGNVELNGNAGSAGNPLQISLLATGSVQVTGNPRITADHSEGILILAEGDVEIGGVASGSTPSYSGLVYAGAQCQMHGTPSVDGHILCYDAGDPVGAADITIGNEFNGTPTVTYDCSGVRRSTMIASWWESRAR
ncbi:MAG: hypothetical protein GWN99_16745 [Gemmatimonadetes bacterium]|uniref:Type 4 fimbrial biogenesis protein PilX N-terminal domain-containing protein n=1 Tax=Candidatus Kutchimonas denitrificans TaxID=3056748 RepID=A0AAE4Z628_9BACT|nr:hypothetical protein [Gemmatimonadota bacterium]NIR74495.1 hypothetical protein [Candidatus Kutchimonas denitrificans]NIS02685.1 hypothetical protein [Gemmatimonadota bacterium]NIT68846.1 hypothetical protein [Gemmatimonadota bacterium]NIU52151.1 hypothetical protein [Gemmatimonadota bacterium]